MGNFKSPPVILVTGASAGLGLSIAKHLIEDQKKNPSRLILTARESSLSRFASEGITEYDHGPSSLWIRSLEVTSPAEQVHLINELEIKLGGVDILINNAGFSYRAVIEQMSAHERELQMNTNFYAALDLIKLVLPTQRKKRAGRIINISSVSGMMAMPTMGGYSASKWALEGASESLWYEVKPWNIRVTLVQPGFIHSDSFRNVRVSNHVLRSTRSEYDPYHRHYRHMTTFIERLMQWSPSTSDRVAKTIVKVVNQKKPPLRVPGTVDAHLFQLLRRLLPRFLYHAVLYRFLPGIRKWGNEPHTQEKPL